MKSEQSAGKRRGRRLVLSVLAAVLLLCAVIVGMCLFNSRPAVQSLDAYRTAFPEAVITLGQDGGAELLPRSEAAKPVGLILYVGAQITPDAYIPLLAPLAEAGYPCYLPKLRCNMASLEPDAAGEIMAAHPETERWVLLGHSMGGLTASGYAADHADQVAGLVFLAAYTNRELQSGALPMLSLYGDEDGVLNTELYEKRREWNSPDFEEHVIPGGNHAQFGDYGEQPRDSAAKITAEAQRAETAAYILDWLDRLG